MRHIQKENSTIGKEDNNITNQNKANPCESNIVIPCVDEYGIAQTLKTIKMKQLP